MCAYHRECLFGEVVAGEMRLNHLGRLVNAVWHGLPGHFPNLELDEFVVMPNHFHGILVLTDNPERDAIAIGGGDRAKFQIGDDTTH